MDNPITKTFVEAFSPNRALMSFDVGTKRIGIAVCDKRHSLVTPVKTFTREKFSLDAPKLIALIKEWQIGGLVVGLPLHMDGQESTMSQSVRDFIRNLQNHDGFPERLNITFFDERMSSQQAENFLINELDMSRAKRKKSIDQLAAVQILENFLYQCKLILR